MHSRAWSEKSSHKAYVTGDINLIAFYSVIVFVVFDYKIIFTHA